MNWPQLPFTDPVLIVAVAMLAFLVTPLVMRRIRTPEIIGLIVVGIIIGPNALHLLDRDATIRLLGAMGLLYIMFAAGLEVDLDDFRRTRARSLVFGLMTFLIPQVLGAYGAYALLGFSPLPAILLGSIFASHTLLAYPVAQRLGLTSHEVVTVAIGGTIITDTLALLVLAVVAKAATGQADLYFWIGLATSITVFSAVVLIGVPLLARWFFRSVSGDGASHFLFVMTVMFAAGYGAGVAGLEPIIGAFMAGFALNRLVPRSGPLANRVGFVGNTLFVPFFLISVGMLVDFRKIIGDWPTIQVALYMSIMVVVCKGAAAMLLKPLFGYNKSQVQVAWGLSVPQAAATLAAVLVGYNLMVPGADGAASMRLFDESVVNGAVVMILVTCIIGPLLVERGGRLLAIAGDSGAGPAAREVPQRIMVPVANPAHAESNLDFAMALRLEGSVEPLLPLSVVQEEDDIAAAVATSERMLGACVVHASAAEVPISPVIRVDINATNGILRALTEMRASTLVIGWAGPQSTWQRTFQLGGGLIDELLQRSSAELIITRLTAPLAVSKRVVLLLPQYAHREPGFAMLVRDFKLMAKCIGAPMLLSGEGAQSIEARAMIERIGPRIGVTVNTAWIGRAIPRCLVEELRGDDLLIIFASRPGTVSWMSRWDRLPSVLAASRKDLSMAVAYPGLSEISVASTQQLVDPLFSAFASLQPRDIRVGINPAPLSQLLGEFVTQSLQMADAGGDIVARLLASVNQLDELTALAHAHITGLVHPRLGVLVVKTPSPITAQQSFRVLFILLNPRGVEAERHLRNLASLARSVRNKEVINHLLTAKDAQQVFDALVGR